MTDDLEKRRAAYRAALDDAMLILKGEERGEEVKLEARLYDALRAVSDAQGEAGGGGDIGGLGATELRR